MSGTKATGAAFITPTQDPNWQAVAVADYNLDGSPDILFQNKTGGRLAIWFMNGTAAKTATYITPNPVPGWQVVGPR